MATFSIPLSPELTEFIEETAKETGLSRSDIVRQAIKLYKEEQAVNAVLQAQKEVSEGKILRGNIDDLLKD
ncbi:MAG: ribbon-helix-helix protein, CopG family [Candidatus Paceibacterota bacterium]